MNDKHEFASELESFFTEARALNDTLRPLLLQLLIGLKEVRKKMTASAKKFPKVPGLGKAKEYAISIHEYREYLALKAEADSYSKVGVTLPRSFVVALVGQYDAYLGRLIRLMFRAKPEMLRGSEKTFTIAQLTEFATIEDAKQYVIAKEVESVLRDSHSEQFSWLERRLDIPLTKDLPVYPIFIEVTERRNLFVHSDGIASTQYLNACTRAGCSADKLCKAGDKLSAPPEYFRQAYAAVTEVGLKLGQVMWRKLHPDQIDSADISLSNISYELITHGQYSQAIRMLDFGYHTLKKHASEEAKLIMFVNLCQAHKWSGAHKKCEEMIRSTDFSASDVKFRLAKAVLLDDTPQAVTLMRKICSSGQVSKDDYRSWPLFKDFRTKQEFLDAYRDIFNESFQAVELPASAFTKLYAKHLKKKTTKPASPRPPRPA